MNKNQANLFRFPVQDPIGKGVTGLTPTAMLSKDGGEFVASTNSITEADATNAPGLYQLQLTQSECNCDLLSVQISLPNGEWAAQCYNLEMSSAGGSSLTAQDVWEYNDRTLTEEISSLTAEEIWEYEERTLTASALTAADVWQYEARTLTASPTDISSLATADALSAVATTADAIKAKTDNLPQSPAATGGEMALTSAAVSAVRSGLSTFNPANTSVIVNADQAATMRTATGFTTPEQLASATYDIVHAMPSTSGLATSADLTSATNSVLSLLNLVFSGIYHWTVNDTLLTVYNSSNVPIGAYTITKDASGAITAVTPIVTTTNAD